MRITKPGSSSEGLSSDFERDGVSKKDLISSGTNFMY